MIYAMIVNNYVIDAIESNEPPIWGNTVNNEPVIAIELNGQIVKRGMIYNPETGSFNNPPEPEPESEPEKQITAAEMIEAVLINTEFLLAVNEMEGL